VELPPAATMSSTMSSRELDVIECKMKERREIREREEREREREREREKAITRRERE